MEISNISTEEILHESLRWKGLKSLVTVNDDQRYLCSIDFRSKYPVKMFITSETLLTWLLD